jgi:hypothetical protein
MRKLLQLAATILLLAAALSTASFGDGTDPPHVPLVI